MSNAPAGRREDQVKKYRRIFPEIAPALKVSLAFISKCFNYKSFPHSLFSKYVLACIWVQEPKGM